MTNQRYRELVLAVLVVIAVTVVSVAAAPLFSDNVGGESLPGIESPTSNDPANQGDSESSLSLRPLLVAVLVIAALAVVAQFTVDPWQTLKQIVGVVAIMAGVIVLLQILPPVNPSSPGSGGLFGVPNETATSTPNESTGFESGSSDKVTLPIEKIALLVLSVVGAGLLAVLAFRSNAIRIALGLATETDNSPDDDDLSAVGSVASNAADRVEEAASPQAADNAVYDAWGEMVALLGAPDPQSGTPRQFAAAALKAGMDPDDVGLLTEAFEKVRYGDAPLSPERREQAMAALRRIEAAHADDSGESPSPPLDRIAGSDLELDSDLGSGGAE